MPAERRTRRALTFMGALLLSSALAAPAFAEIEEIVVTAQKRAEDIQSVPIAITAFTAQDLQAHQINQFKDLVFNTPNVSYTKANFTGSDFQIRGIGITAIGYDAESGVAVHVDDVFLSNPPLAEAAFFDLDRIEVLRGPQSTLYGRGATGGTVNVITAKPVLDAFHADLEGTVGNYGLFETRGMVNLPIVDGQLGVRIAGDWLNRDGFVTNVFNGNKIDSRNQVSFRASARWEPTTHTTIDVVAATEHEGDSRMRAQKQYCATDPTGTLGCLPDSITNGLVNLNSNLATIASSVQGFESAGLPGTLGLFDLTQQPQIPPACLQPGSPCNPSDPRKVYTDFTPRYKADDTFYALNWKQNLASWLDSTLVLGWDRNKVWSQESYNNVAGLPFDPNTLAVAEGTELFLLNALGGPNYAAIYAPFFLSHPGELPESGTKHLGLTGGDIRAYLPGVSAFDQSDGWSSQYSAELRFNTNFQGPLNFLLAGYYLKVDGGGDYFVNSPTLDYASIILGSILGSPGLGGPAFCASGCILAPGFYHNVGNVNTLTSKAIFGEAYYDAIPDTLKFTVGLRWTNDEKFQQGRIELYNGLVPLGSANEKIAMQTLVAQQQVDFDAAAPGFNVWQNNSVTYNKLTGRAVADWTPKLDFTDATLVYASYARGYKAGGFNPGIQPGLGVPPSYDPESVDAFEIGTKNTLLGATLQANLTGWYYNYKSLQVSAIENNTSVNENINAKLWGVEGEFFWAPIENLQLNLSFGTTHSSIGNNELVDDRNPTAGRDDVLLVKDATLGANVGQNCVLYYNGATPGSLPVGLGFFAPPGGVDSLASHGVPHTSFGTCSSDPLVVAALAAQGFAVTDPTGHGTHSGAFVNLSGNQLQNTPDFTLSIGGQYTFELGGGYTLVPRVDYYWQTGMYGRIFNDPSDKISSWGVGNAQVTLNAPDSMWYVTGWIKNFADSDNITGAYLTSSTSGLYTNAFLGDPRTYGLTAGIHF
ncbi:MAG TPA: TonB-dependent receptor [Rhizomicrobium sp.]|nr:TonB-dependent receptor [Rhizomicrobium sp.]